MELSISRGSIVYLSGSDLEFVSSKFNLEEIIICSEPCLGYKFCEKQLL